MKQIILGLLVASTLYACSKNGTALRQQPPETDYSRYKVEKAVHSSRNYSVAPASYSADTTLYTYDGTTCKYTQRRNGSIYEYTASLSDGLYTQHLYANGVLSGQKTYYKLNAAGYIDSNWIVSNTTLIQSSKYQYNADGTLALSTNYYSGYINRVRYNYKNGVADYAYNERIAQLPSIPNLNDSMVYEYAVNLPYRAGFYSTGLPISFLGKSSKYLLQKAIYYDKLNGNAIRQTTEYQYQTDEIGLVTRRVFNIYTHPGNTLLLTDTTAYTYYGK